MLTLSEKVEMQFQEFLIKAKESLLSDSLREAFNVGYAAGRNFEAFNVGYAAGRNFEEAAEDESTSNR